MAVYAAWPQLLDIGDLHLQSCIDPLQDLTPAGEISVVKHIRYPQ